MKVIHVLRKPCSEGTVAANVLRWGTGALNIDATRVAHANSSDLDAHRKMVEAIKFRGGSMANSWKNSSDLSGANDVSSRGRWPANLVLQHLDGCVQDSTETIAAWTCALGTRRRWSEAMKVVHVLRKPCSESTVAANVLRWGAGALNIDATRIGYESGEVDFDRVQRQQHSEGAVTGAFGAASLIGNVIPTYNPSGRWPANLVLQHFDGCVEEGAKKVKASSPASGPTLTGVSTSVARKKMNGVESSPHYCDPDGTETVAAWTCAPGCPVAALDVQSGVLKSGALPHDQYTTGGRDNSSMFAGKGVFTHKGYGADTGGASRFFHQSHTPPYDYFRKLISPDHLPDVVYLHVTAPDTLAKENDAAVHAMTVLAASTDTHWIPHALRALKPGGHLLLAAPDAEPTNDTLVCAAEGAGFEVRDCIFLADSADDRLHYVAKAGKKEREAGLERMPAKAFAASGGAQGALADSEDEGSAEYGGEGDIGLNRITMRKNTHPTVKPVAVMRRLLAGVRRDLPVLDPFVGSGTTLLACVAEGYDGIGVEREGEYFAIATARVDARVSGMLATRTDGEARAEWVEEG